MTIVIFVIGPVISAGMIGAIIFAVAGGYIIGELQQYYEHIMLIVGCIWIVISVVVAIAAKRSSRSANTPCFFLALLCIIAWAIAPTSMYFGNEELSLFLVVGWVLFIIYSFILGAYVRKNREDRYKATALHKMLNGTGFSATAIILATTIFFEVGNFETGNYGLNTLSAFTSIIELLIGFVIYFFLFIILTMPYYKLAKYESFLDYLDL